MANAFALGVVGALMRFRRKAFKSMPAVKTGPLEETMTLALAFVVYVCTTLGRSSKTMESSLLRLSVD